MDEALIVFVAVLVMAVVVVAPILILSEQFDYWSAEAEIEQLRGDLQKVSVQESEDVIGQVTQWNQIIARKRMYNDILLVCMFVPNGWDRIEPLEIPSR